MLKISSKSGHNFAYATTSELSQKFPKIISQIQQILTTNELMNR